MKTPDKITVSILYKIQWESIYVNGVNFYCGEPPLEYSSSDVLAWLNLFFDFINQPVPEIVVQSDDLRNYENDGNNEIDGLGSPYYLGNYYSALGIEDPPIDVSHPTTKELDFIYMFFKYINKMTAKNRVNCYNIVHVKFSSKQAYQEANSIVNAYMDGIVVEVSGVKRDLVKIQLDTGVSRGFFETSKSLPDNIQGQRIRYHCKDKRVEILD